jgi:mRNA interferase MazF
MVIRQGEIYWVDFGKPIDSEPGYRRPCVVVQNNVFNSSRIHTALVCAVTSTLRLGKAPGNVVLEKGEAGLDKKSVVNVSQVMTVDKSMLAERIGMVSKERLADILAGLTLLFEPREIEYKG